MKSLINDVSKKNETREVVDHLTFILSLENGFMWDDVYAFDQLDEISKDNLVCQVPSKCKLVTV
jgi:callose synthase